MSYTAENEFLHLVLHGHIQNVDCMLLRLLVILQHSRETAWGKSTGLLVIIPEFSSYLYHHEWLYTHHLIRLSVFSTVEWTCVLFSTLHFCYVSQKSLKEISLFLSLLPSHPKVNSFSSPHAPPWCAVPPQALKPQRQPTMD